MALADYHLDETRVTFIRHHENITFQVIDQKRLEIYLLRLHKPINENFIGIRQQPAAIASELLWLEALHRDTPLIVQQPVRNVKGELVTTLHLEMDSIPCSLLRWIEGGAFLQDTARAPIIAEALGEVVAQLHDHARDNRSYRSLDCSS